MPTMRPKITLKDPIFFDPGDPGHGACMLIQEEVQRRERESLPELTAHEIYCWWRHGIPLTGTDAEHATRKL